MAFVPWKDRVTSTPHRYKLTEVSADTYDLEAVPGSISEAGTPVNAANLNKLIQRDGDDIKDTVVAFTEASTRANIATGEKTSTIFGKIKKWYTDLKTHAFTTPSATQSTSADTVPSSKLLKESSFARVYRSLEELTGITSTSTPLDVMMAMDNSSVLIADISAYANVLPTDAKTSFSGGMLELSKLNVNRAIARYTAKENASTLNTRMWFGEFQVTVTGYEWSDWHEVVSDKTAQTITGVKTYTASPIVPTTPSGPSAAVSKSYADSVGFARVYRTFEQLGIPNSSTPAKIHAAMINRSKALIPVSTYDNPAYGNTGLELPNNLFYGLEAIRHDDQRLSLKLVSKMADSDVLYHYEGMYWNYGTTDKFTGWKRIINDEDAQTITGIKEFTASPIVPTTPSGPSAAVAKSYVDGLSTPYDKVIRTQTEFEELISSPNWLGAESVALVGQFTLSTANNSGIKVPATVKQIHGFNSAKITVTNFVYNMSTANAGLWYDTLPTTNDYSIRDLEVDCTGIGSVELVIGFRRCSNLTNCTGTGTGTGTGATGFGFRNCTNLTNCTGTGRGSNGYGFRNCTNLTNCTGTGTGAYGYGFWVITYASNCKDGGSTTAMWDGTNKNIDIDTCCKTPVTANNTTLNT